MKIIFKDYLDIFEKYPKDISYYKNMKKEIIKMK